MKQILLDQIHSATSCIIFVNYKIGIVRLPRGTLMVTETVDKMHSIDNFFFRNSNQYYLSYGYLQPHFPFPSTTKELKVHLRNKASKCPSKNDFISTYSQYGARFHKNISFKKFLYFDYVHLTLSSPVSFPLVHSYSKWCPL